MGKIKEEFESKNVKTIQQCIDFGTIYDFLEFREKCDEIFVKANNYIQNLLSLKDEFFGLIREINNDKKEKLKEEFF